MAVNSLLLSGTAVWRTTRPPSGRAETMCVRGRLRAASNEARTVLPSTAQASSGSSASSVSASGSTSVPIAQDTSSHRASRTTRGYR